MATLRELSDRELVHELLAVEYDLVGLKMRHRAGLLESTSVLLRARRRVATINTALRERELARELPKHSLAAEHRDTFVRGGAGEAGGSGASKGGFLSGVVDKLSGQH